jgi:molybdenum-dependent DNA-binding transcriptional regulator ModE
MTYKEKAQDIYSMMASGQLMDAFEKYYAENIVMTEPRGTREGKSTCREYEKNFLASIEDFHGLDVKSVTSDEDNGVTTVVSVMDVTLKGMGRVQMEQAAVQEWDGDQIKKETFYYDNSQG